MKETGLSGSHELGVDVQFWASLTALDEAIAEQVRAACCQHCGGRLDRADYPRKPRGGALATEAESWCVRLSLCCAREGCRRRSTPPSVRFLGRRVYVEILVLVACLRALADSASTAAELAQVPRRTVARWQSWWRTAFVVSALWLELRSRLVPPADEGRLPASLLERLDASSPWLSAACLLAPCTTLSVPDGSRFVRLAM